ncbi:hypothetical protein [Roseibium sediminicola]|uniref:Uncharacterized protein n=1 Tax=Roseibium sediminicola TaxID=2933272 RepID=A0ABT0H1U7_9HYPH|nr:hypothetical protein [Roseibium sp. CAU 1639]MCK7615663.1 hypothetical protein [Roseibium sp. CAU 1639]
MILQRLMFTVPVVMLCSTFPAGAADVDFARFMASASGAAGLSAAISSLGQCDTAPQWAISYDPEIDGDNPNHVYVGCQYDPDWEEGTDLYDKGILAKFVESEQGPVLVSLTQLP